MFYCDLLRVAGRARVPTVPPPDGYRFRAAPRRTSAACLYAAGLGLLPYALRVLVDGFSISALYFLNLLPPVTACRADRCCWRDGARNALEHTFNITARIFTPALLPVAFSALPCPARCRAGRHRAAVPAWRVRAAPCMPRGCWTTILVLGCFFFFIGVHVLRALLPGSRWWVLILLLQIYPAGHLPAFWRMVRDAGVRRRGLVCIAHEHSTRCRIPARYTDAWRRGFILATAWQTTAWRWPSRRLVRAASRTFSLSGRRWRTSLT